MLLLPEGHHFSGIFGLRFKLDDSLREDKPRLSTSCPLVRYRLQITRLLKRTWLNNDKRIVLWLTPQAGAAVDAEPTWLGSSIW
jgi:hypothetical protein